MKYLLIVFLAALLIYMFSFVSYNWSKKNRLAAIGSIIIALAAAALPLYIVFFGNY